MGICRGENYGSAYLLTLLVYFSYARAICAQTHGAIRSAGPIMIWNRRISSFRDYGGEFPNSCL